MKSQFNTFLITIRLFFFLYQQAFLDIDEALLNAEELKHEMGGSTAVVCLMKDKKLYCANAGDSRAIACVNGQVRLHKFKLRRIYFNFYIPLHI